MDQKTDNSTDWFAHSFGELYPLLYAHRDDTSARAEVISLINLVGLKPPARILDVCCGAGRHLQTLLELGFDAHGFDLSDHLLDQAKQRPGLVDRVTQADIRDIPFKESFDAAVNLFTSFGYFADDAENEAALHQIVSALRPQGTLVMDLVNREHLEQNFKPADQHTLKDSNLHVAHRRTLTDTRIEKETTVTDPKGQVRTFHESVRLFTPDEMQAMCDRAGINQLRFFGSHNGADLSPDQPRMILTGVKA